jgi:uncharacterized protein (DUF1697 family)
MNTYIALLRGINILGNRSLPMKDLKRMLERNGCVDVRTYIQSGNAIFRSAVADRSTIARRVRAAVAKRHGFEPHVLVLTHKELERAAAGNPFAQIEGDPRKVHLFFLAEPPSKPDLKSLESLKVTENFTLKERVFYLHTPDGFGKSKIASRAERLLGVDATARNWRTVTTLLQMCQPSSVDQARGTSARAPI